MNVAETQSAAPKPSIRWFRVAPGRCLAALLAVEVLLWLSERFGWLGWHKGYAVLTSVAVVGVAVLLMLVWFGVSLVFRRRFQFRLRSLLGLVVVVALACSWMTAEMKAAKEQREAVEPMILASYDWQHNEGWPGKNQDPPEPELLRTLLGDDFFHDIVAIDLTDDVEMQRLRRLPRLRELRLFGPKITYEAFQYLEGLSALQTLRLRDIQITDAWLKHLAGLSRLQDVTIKQEFDLDVIQITDAGLRHLAGLSRLQALCLDHAQITDGGLQQLAGLSRLQRLSLNFTQVTDGGLRLLAKLSGLQELHLDETTITDAGLPHLIGLSQLRYLSLGCVGITDVGLQYLTGLTQLERLGLNGNPVTDAGVAKLQKALPNCKITR